MSSSSEEINSNTEEVIIAGSTLNTDDNTFTGDTPVGSTPEGHTPTIKTAPLEKNTLEAAAEEFSNEFDIQLEFFSGPMDLLLHLVSLKEVPIEEVSMAEIIDQYFDIVTKQAHQIDLERASDYLVIITTLMVIKSRSLLPNESAEDVEDEEDTEYSRFFESLRERLKAFELTRLRAQALIDAPQLGVDTFVRNDKNAIEIPAEMIAEGETSVRLGSLFLGLVKRVGGIGKKMRIAIEPVSIVDSMMRVVDSLKIFSKKTPSTLYSIIKNTYQKNDFQNRLISRNIVMGGFIAVLELAKRGVVTIQQPSQEESISVVLRSEMFDHDLNNSNEKEIFESEFDHQTVNSQAVNSQTVNSHSEETSSDKTKETQTPVIEKIDEEDIPDNVIQFQASDSEISSNEISKGATEEDSHIEKRISNG